MEDCSRKDAKTQKRGLSFNQLSVQVLTIESPLQLGRRGDRYDRNLFPRIRSELECNVPHFIEPEDSEPNRVTGLSLSKVRLQKCIARPIAIDGHDLVAGVQALLVSRCVRRNRADRQPIIFLNEIRADVCTLVRGIILREL